MMVCFHIESYITTVWQPGSLVGLSPCFISSPRQQCSRIRLFSFLPSSPVPSDQDSKLLATVKAIVDY